MLRTGWYTHGKEVNRTPKCKNIIHSKYLTLPLETFPYTELDQNRTDIYFRDREVLYLFKLLILGDKRFELLKAHNYWVYSSTLLTNKGTLLFFVLVSEVSLLPAKGFLCYRLRGFFVLASAVFTVQAFFIVLN